MEKVLLFGESMKQQNATLNKISQSYADSAKEKQPKTIPRDFRQIIEEKKMKSVCRKESGRLELETL